jgi:hypothetical protein
VNRPHPTVLGVETTLRTFLHRRSWPRVNSTTSLLSPKAAVKLAQARLQQTEVDIELY